MTLTEEVIQYHQQLLDSDAGLQYLEDRGITRRSIGEFCLGQIVEPLSREAAPYRGKPVIPYMASTGKCIWGRTRVGGNAKYVPWRTDFPFLEPRIHLFNAKQAMPSPTDPRVFIIEGEYDAIIAMQCGLRAVAVPGARQWNAVWTHLFAESEVIVAFDGDDTGRDAANKLVQLFTSRRINARYAPLPDDADVTDLYLRGGKAAVLEVLR